MKPNWICAPEIRARLEAALVDDCPLASRDGGLIRGGFHAELDTLRDLSAGGKQWMAQYQADEIARTGIPSLKVGFNKVFGYYLEVTHTHGHKIPDNYQRKQTVKNAERYVTPELKEHEEKVLTAEERAKELEYELFVELREATAVAAKRLQATAAVLAQLDVLAALAALARQRGYCRPRCVEEPVLRIIDGRHPVLDILAAEGTFVPNDTHCGPLATARVKTARSKTMPTHDRDRRRPNPADHRPEHGRQKHLHPPGGAADAHGPDRQLRAGARSGDRFGRSDFRPRRRRR